MLKIVNSINLVLFIILVKMIFQGNVNHFSELVRKKLLELDLLPCGIF